MGKRILEVVPYVVFLVALFFVEYNLFGVEDALLGIVFQSFAKTMVETIGLSFANYLKHAFLFFLMSLCASVAGLHPVLLVCGSALYMFGITLLNSVLPTSKFLYAGNGFFAFGNLSHRNSRDPLFDLAQLSLLLPYHCLYLCNESSEEGK